ncbi:MAG: chloride channel protein [Spirochaetaceae bacterium]|jgi:H+/Cl- antiporter ClcA|nr:chloride channel protein [Spirochaetaceae bacterium]
MLYIRNWRGFRVVILFESALIGLITGGVIAGYRHILTLFDTLRRLLYTTLLDAPAHWTAVLGAAVTGVSFFLGWACKTRPGIKGGGIPQIKNPAFQSRSWDWVIDMPLKWVTTLLSLGMGLSLGKGGPAVQIGSYIGKGAVMLFPRGPEENAGYIKSAGAAAFAGVFNAPLAGVLFAVEELGMPLSPLFLACSMSAAVTADLTVAACLNTGALFDFTAIQPLSIALLPWVLLLGFLAALAADLFKRGIYRSLSWYEQIPPLLRPLIPSAAAVILGFLCFDLTGGGYELILSLSREARTLQGICFLLAGKLLFTALCAGSGVPGGIFFPLLCCGALVGSGVGSALALAGIASEAQILNFMILGIAAFFTATHKAPLTGILLILEMSGTINHLGTLVPVCLTGLIASELIMSRSINEVLLERQP